MCPQRIALWGVVCVCMFVGSAWAEEAATAQAPSSELPAIKALMLGPEVTPTPGREGMPEMPAFAPPDKRIHGTFVLEFLTAYYYRGFLQENHGVIAQPALRLDVDVWRGDDTDWLQNISLIGAVRGSFHEEQTWSDGTGADIWYELDAVGGFGFRFLDRWTFETKYVSISSPNDAWDTINEIDIDLAFDDAGLWPGDFAVKPHMLIAYEFDGSAAGQQEGTLMELSIEPGMTVVQSRTIPVRLSFPMKVGLSLDDYYVLPWGGEDETFGFFKAGVSLTVPLTFVPPDLGQWAIIGGVDWIFLGDNTQMLNMNDDTDVVGRIGLGARF